MVDDKLLYSPDEALKILGLGRSKVMQLLASGDLPSIKIGRLRRIPAEALHAWIRQQVVTQVGDVPDAPERETA